MVSTARIGIDKVKYACTRTSGSLIEIDLEYGTAFSFVKKGGGK